MFGQSEAGKIEETLTSNTMAFETTAIMFFIILLICLICILLLLAIFLYKCYQGHNHEEPVKTFCTGENEGEDCLAVNAEMDKPRDQDKVLLHFVDMGIPVRPSILVQRQSKEEMATSVGDNIKAEEYKNRQTHQPVNARETNHEDELAEKIPIHVHRSSVSGSQKRPLKGVTFSKEVIVVDLGKEYPTPQSYAREHKERK
ncbi:uncharacterized protein C2orf74 homolog [Mastomys coucha]|uniref:uncharacterized protein C2orf74 homolog n=1 Tax=Mastomys coucha TaxID=35658 RepID=UPI0012619F4B|nr:uncharacterized protein C2orf74 homolog [Mastomys coucha]XP_031198798.1 uncharacterized protein C2orf74 homolog [Mastomys coucha]